MLEGIGKILGFAVLSGDLAVTRKKTMKVAIEFSKNGVILSKRFSSVQLLENQIEVGLIKNAILRRQMRE